MTNISLEWCNWTEIRIRGESPLKHNIYTFINTVVGNIVKI